MAFDKSTNPTSTASGNPPETHSGGAEARLLALKFESLEDKISNLLEFNKTTAAKVDALATMPIILSQREKDIAEIKSDSKSNFRWLLGLGIGAVAFLLIITSGSFLRLSSLITDVSNGQTKTNTQLEDLISRVPPAQTSINSPAASSHKSPR
jgi:hypothetical protein